MTFAEIQPELDRLDALDKRRAVAFLMHQIRATDTEYQAEMGKRHLDMDAGNKLSFSDFKAQLATHGE